jgi:hypothetical protein
MKTAITSEQHSAIPGERVNRDKQPSQSNAHTLTTEARTVRSPPPIPVVLAVSATSAGQSLLPDGSHSWHG